MVSELDLSVRELQDGLHSEECGIQILCLPEGKELLLEKHLRIMLVEDFHYRREQVQHAVIMSEDRRTRTDPELAPYVVTVGTAGAY